jgi:hypothetical protein
MKLSYKFPLLIGLLLIAGSCEDTLNDVEPTREFEEAYFDSEGRVEKAVGAIYGKIVEIYGGSFGGGTTKHVTWLLPADDLTAENAGVAYDAFETLNPSDGRVAGVWGVLYEIIARSNFVLEQLDNPSVQAVYADPDLLDTNRGEVLFLRSWANMWLWDWWRKAPLITERISSLEDAIKPPSTGFELLNQAITDLETAAPNLPEAWPTDQLGRITQDAAYGMLVKAYMLRGSYDNNNAEDYQRAIAAFENITTRELTPSFGQNFDINFENNVE